MKRVSIGFQAWFAYGNHFRLFFLTDAEAHGFTQSARTHTVDCGANREVIEP